MRDILNNRTKLVATTVFILMQSSMVVAEDRLFTGVLGASELWDSNFFRDPDDLAVSEQITLLTAGFALSTNISRQQLSLRWRVKSYQHAENDQFDKTFQDGVARWNGSWAGDFTTNAELSRDSYLIDRWELESNVEESDVVSRDIGKFVLTKGRENRFSFQVGASKTKQKHSNTQFDNLDYEDDEGFVGVTYKTPSHSTFTVRYRANERVYDDPPLPTNADDPRDYNFKGQQVEVENVWKMSEKTTSTITLARFNRDGDLNDSTGDYASLDLSWDATPKMQWHTGYTYKKPAIGETIDAPTTIETGFVSLSWDITPKLTLSSRAEKLWRDYSYLAIQPSEPDSPINVPRKESQINISPLELTYTMNESLSFKLDTSWRRNKSPINDREYEVSQASLGMAFRF